MTAAPPTAPPTMAPTGVEDPWLACSDGEEPAPAGAEVPPEPVLLVLELVVETVFPVVVDCLVLAVLNSGISFELAKTLVTPEPHVYEIKGGLADSVYHKIVLHPRPLPQSQHWYTHSPAHHLRAITHQTLDELSEYRNVPSSHFVGYADTLPPGAAQLKKLPFVVTVSSARQRNSSKPEGPQPGL
jgi:hypothetical protein